MAIVSAISFLVLVLLIFFDARILKQYDRDFYKKHFRVSWITVGAAIFFLLSSLAGNVDVLLTVFMIFVLPFYCIKRKKFLKTVQEQSFLNPRHYVMTEAIGIIYLCIFAAIIINVILGIFTEVFPQFKDDLGEILIVDISVSIFMIGLIYRVTSKAPWEGFLRSVGLYKSGASFVKVLFIPMSVGLLFAAISSKIIDIRKIQPVTPLDRILESTNSPWTLTAFIILAILVAPLIEEIVFRGYLYRVLRQFKGEIFAIGCISAIFALLHVEQYWGDWMAIMMVALVGFSLTILRFWTKTTLSSIVMHYIYNGSVVFIPIITLLLSNPSYAKYYISYPMLTAVEKETLLLESIKADPQLAEAYNDLAWFYTQENKKLEEALMLINKALAFEPERFTYLDTKAEVLYKMGKIKEAIMIEDALVKKYPDNSFAKEQLEKYKKALHVENPS